MLALKLKKYFFILIMICAFIKNAQAEYSVQAPHATLEIIPEYNTLSPKINDFSILHRLKLNQGWHIYWQNPGDTGEPTILSYYDNPSYKQTSLNQTAPQKVIFNDIITIYAHKGTVYFKTDFKRLNQNLQNKNLHFKFSLHYTACKEECLPEVITYDFSLKNQDEAAKNPDYVTHFTLSEKNLPLLIQPRIKVNTDKLTLTFAEPLLASCENPEFISIYKKKSPLKDLPTSQKVDDYTLDVNFDQDELPASSEGLMLCNNDKAYKITSDETNIIPLIVQAKEAEPPLFIHHWLYYVLTAFLAGLILNLMPCVLPVISLKALYLAAHKEKASLTSALIYLLGVISSFTILSGLLFYLRDNTSLGWGFQLQSPLFNLFLLLLFCAIFLNLLDKLSLPSSFADSLNKLSGNKSFLTGFFAVLIACPCTGPFMGAALGYALSAPPLIYFAIFLSLSLGYGLPYVLIEAYPKILLKYIPHPGPWMITLKHWLALPIGLTILWLGWVIYNQLIIPNTPQEEDLIWHEYNSAEIIKKIENNQPVFIDFTAKWCLVCLVNDKTALNSAEFKNIVKNKHIALYVADWTNHNKEIAIALKHHGRNSIPLYVYYKKGSSTPVYLPQILTPEILKKVLN